MTPRNDATRMGMLGLLLLVVAICLAVLGALSLVTAHGDAVLSERHRDSAELTERVDRMGQELLAQFDGWLARTASQQRGSAASFSSARLAADLERELPALADGAASEAAAATSMGAVEELSVHIDAAALDRSELPASAPVGALGGMRAVITANDTRTLTLVAAVGADLTCELLEYALTTEWAEEPSDMMLWEG